MPALFERFGDVLLCRLRFLTRREWADALHQIVAQLDAVFVRLACRELPARFVLAETVLGRMRGLADVERRQSARLRGARAREFDDVDGEGARRS
jgi:hypothetical protein